MLNISGVQVGYQVMLLYELLKGEVVGYFGVAVSLEA